MSERTKALFKNRAASGGMLLLVAFAVTGAAQLFTNLAVGAMLGPAGFSEAGTIMAVMSLTGVPVMAFQAAVTGLVVRGGHPAPAVKAVLGAAVAGAVVMSATAPLWSQLVAVRSTSSAVFAACFVPATVLMCSARGVALGLGRSRQVAFALTLTALVRCVAVPVAASVAQVPGAVAAVVVSELVGALLLLWSVRMSGSRDVRLTFGSTAKAASTQTAVWVLVNVDLLWARHLLAEADAGRYLLAAGMAFGLVSLGQAVAWHRSRQMADAESVRRAAFAAAVVVAASGFVLVPAAALLLPKILGPQYGSLTWLLTVGVVSAVGMSVVSTAVLGSIVASSPLLKRLTVAAFVATASAPIFVSLFGRTPEVLAVAAAFNAWLGVLVAVSSTLWRKKGVATAANGDGSDRGEGRCVSV